MTDTEYFKKRLTEDQVKLRQELDRLGIPSPTGEWDARAPDIDVMEADLNEAADRMEEMHIDQIVLDELLTRYKLVVHALERIDSGAYGTCAVGNHPIEDERLNANPAARTCKAHMSEESSLTL